LIDRGIIESVTSREILLEYDMVMKSREIVRKVQEKNLLVSEMAQRVLESMRIVSPRMKLQIVKDDPDDDMVLECALEAGAAYLITYDRHLRIMREFVGIRILTPEEFLNRVV
jgi:uncharacterized protein